MEFQIGDLVTINPNSTIGIPKHIGELCEVISDNRTALYHYRVTILNSRQTIPVYEKEITKINPADPILTFSLGENVTYHPTGESGVITKIDYFYRQIEVKFHDEAHGVFNIDLLKKEKGYINTPLKIGLLGKMRSGKDTIAEYATKKYRMKQFAFGDELKRYYHELFGNTKQKPRSEYIWFGQTLRQHDPDIWVKKCFEAIDKSNLKNIVISDIRQPNEVIKCKKEGFILIKIDCDDEIRLQRILQKNDQFNPEDLQHETEKYIDAFDYDYLIHNNSDLEGLYIQFDRVIENIREKEKWT